MFLVKLKRKLQKNKFGIRIIKIYHNLVGVPLAKFHKFQYNFVKKDIKQMNFYSIEETFDMLIKENKSLSRFGDGEISWIYQESKEYFGQENSKELSNNLKKVLLSDCNNILIGIPGYFGTQELYTERFKSAAKAHLSVYGKKWMNFLDENRLYVDQLITRPYFGFDIEKCKMLFNLWRKVWNQREILIIEGSKTKFGIGNDLLSNAKKIERIIAPAENAYSKYEEILKVALKYVDNNKIILIALGPTASILSYDLAQLGYQAIDIGHLDIEYEWYIQKAKTKIPIKGKYVNEVNGSPLDEIDEKYKKSYEKQIVANLE